MVVNRVTTSASQSSGWSGMSKRTGRHATRQRGRQREQRTGRVVGRGTRFVDGMQPDAVGEPARHPAHDGESARQTRRTPSPRSRAGTCSNARSRRSRAATTRSGARTARAAARRARRSAPRPGPDVVASARSATAPRRRAVCVGQNTGASAGAARTATGSGCTAPRQPSAARSRSQAPSGRRDEQRVLAEQRGADDRGVRLPRDQPELARVAPHVGAERFPLAGCVAVVVERGCAPDHPTDVVGELRRGPRARVAERERARGDEMHRVGRDRVRGVAHGIARSSGRRTHGCRAGRARRAARDGSSQRRPPGPRSPPTRGSSTRCRAAPGPAASRT